MSAGPRSCRSCCDPTASVPARAGRAEARGAVGGATLTRPITGGSRGWPFGAAIGDLESFGYIEEEWFLEGEATTYDFVPGTEASFDGRWEIEAVGAVPYRTRMLIRRPVDPARANGT